MAKVSSRPAAAMYCVQVQSRFAKAFHCIITILKKKSHFYVIIGFGGGGDGSSSRSYKDC